MQKIKNYWNKFKIWIGLFVGGMIVSYLVLRKHIGSGLEEQKMQYAKEEEAKKASVIKLDQETKKLEEKKQEEVKAVDEDKKQKLKEAVARAKEEKKKLVDEAKRDPQGFKVDLRKELGVKEKKKKGRPKKDE